MSGPAVVVGIGLLVLAGCKSPAVTEYPAPQKSQTTDTWREVAPSKGLMDVYRIEDHERGVTCYVYNGSQQGGIHCMPPRGAP